MSQIPDSEQPGLPQRPVPLPKEQFSLSRGDWTAYFIGAVVILATLPFQRSTPHPVERLVPYIFGQNAIQATLQTLRREQERDRSEMLRATKRGGK